jgi:uncharacterized DUF497 family protein
VKVAWDGAKNLANQRKHGVSFEEASELFRSDVDYLEIFDEEHSAADDRFIAIGPIRRGLVLIVWTEQDEEPFVSSALGGQQNRSRSCITHIWKKHDD